MYCIYVLDVVHCCIDCFWSRANKMKQSFVIQVFKCCLSFIHSSSVSESFAPGEKKPNGLVRVVLNVVATLMLTGHP